VGNRYFRVFITCQKVVVWQCGLVTGSGEECAPAWGACRAVGPNGRRRNELWGDAAQMRHETFLSSLYARALPVKRRLFEEDL
jgi:hypothetical protein